MNLYTDVSRLETCPDVTQMVVDIPLYSSSKFEYDEEKGYFTLDRTLYSPLYYPFEYGFVPQTKGEDGDAIDVVTLASRPTFPGCVVKVRPVGVLRMSDEEGVDHKIICVPDVKIDPRFAHINDIDDIEEHIKKECELFLTDYKKLEPGKYEQVRVDGFGDKSEACDILSAGAERYDQE